MHKTIILFLPHVTTIRDLAVHACCPGSSDCMIHIVMLNKANTASISHSAVENHLVKLLHSGNEVIQGFCGFS